MKHIRSILLAIALIGSALACSDNKENAPLHPDGVLWASATLPSSVEVALPVTIPGEGFLPSDTLLLKHPDGTIFSVPGARFTDTGVTFTLPEDLKGGNYLLCLKRGNLQALLGSLKVIAKPVVIPGKKIKQIIFSDGWDPATWQFAYDDQGRVSKVSVTYLGAPEEYNLAYDNEDILISGTSELTLRVQEGRIISTDYPGNSQVWQYDDAGYLTVGDGISYLYTDGNLSAVASSYALDFSGAERRNDYKRIDQVACIYWVYLFFEKQTIQFLPHLLGLCGMTSEYLPIAESGGAPIQYIWDSENQNIERITFESASLGTPCSVEFFYE